MFCVFLFYYIRFYITIKINTFIRFPSSSLKKRLDAEIDAMRLQAHLKKEMEKVANKNLELSKVKEALQRSQEENQTLQAKLEIYEQGEEHLSVRNIENEINGN